MDTRRLLLMRHGKSDWPAGVPDRERPVSSRGRKDSNLVAAAVLAGGFEPDYVVVSPARRTGQTWERFRAGLRADPVASTDERIYAGGVEDLLAVIRETPEEYDTLLLIGHNPGTEALVRLLDPADDGPRERLAGGYPTATLTVFEVGTSWAEVSPGSARCVDVIIPRELK